jgi:CheY-like chemotaxis protein
MNLSQLVVPPHLLQLRRHRLLDATVLDAGRERLEGFELRQRIAIGVVERRHVHEAHAVGLLEHLVAHAGRLVARDLHEHLLDQRLVLGGAFGLELVADHDGFHEGLLAKGHFALDSLLAEDNIVNQRVAQLLLGGMGYQIEIVENGLQALELVAAAKERGQPFDVVLLDVQMPVLDGLETSRRLCELYPDAKQRPWMIAMTAKRHARRPRGMPGGGDG